MQSTAYVANMVILCVRVCACLCEFVCSICLYVCVWDGGVGWGGGGGTAPKSLFNPLREFVELILRVAVCIHIGVGDGGNRDNTKISLSRYESSLNF